MRLVSGCGCEGFAMVAQIASSRNSCTTLSSLQSENFMQFTVLAEFAVPAIDLHVGVHALACRRQPNGSLQGWTPT
jgi:hypothetical protein